MGPSVQKPLDAISELVKQAPTHPYAKLGETKFKELTQQAEEFFKNAGISTQGDHEENHYRVTPMGTLKPTWLTLKNLLISENEKCLPSSIRASLTSRDSLIFTRDSSR